MTLAGTFEIALTIALVLIAAYPLGAFMAGVFENRRTFLTPLVGPIERILYRVAGVDPKVEQEWFGYAISMVVFGGACMLSLYALLRLQAYLPLNPQGFPGVPPDLAFNIAVSFVTNTNWQAYAGETTLSHFSQMVGLTANNFMDSAAATAMAVALTRALARRESPTIGNFWVDVTRTTLYVLLPLSLLVALAFAALYAFHTIPPRPTGQSQERCPWRRGERTASTERGFPRRKNAATRTLRWSGVRMQQPGSATFGTLATATMKRYTAATRESQPGLTGFCAKLGSCRVASIGRLSNVTQTRTNPGPLSCTGQLA
jgi:hypothetical protein